MKYDKPLVEIIWNDAETTHGWELDADIDSEQVPIVTVGFLVTKGDHVVVIASSIDQATGGQSNSRIKIPIAMVSSIKELNVTYKKLKVTSPSPVSDEVLVPLIASEIENQTLI
ncbi:hypothetical protein UFOVP1590_2 [uncultured Caudovirales phage]|uniref:Uncharacterized protein n=1 Tax=uncultured Caudovirales phage TaxID=2100421 RepID=A0A6J5SQU7_9CAUD|nr:hypothetical protein UFOVP1590_2 [uncultured Caudovirales phage]